MHMHIYALNKKKAEWVYTKVISKWVGLWMILNSVVWNTGITYFKPWLKFSPAT